MFVTWGRRVGAGGGQPPLLLLMLGGGGDEENRVQAKIQHPTFRMFNIQSHVTKWEEGMHIVPLYFAGIGLEGYIYIRFKSPNFSLYPGSGLAFDWEVCGSILSYLAQSTSPS